MPPDGKSGLYIYNNSILGAALKKELYINNKPVGAIANGTFHKFILEPNTYKISTTSEFGQNHLNITLLPNQNHFVRHYIKMGVFVGGANLEIVDNKEVKKTYKN